VRINSPFHLCSISSRTYGFNVTPKPNASLRRPGITLCQLIQLSKSFGFPWEAPHSRWGVQRSNRNKKPGIERRANSSAIRRIHSKLDWKLSRMRNDLTKAWGRQLSPRPLHLQAQTLGSIAELFSTSSGVSFAFCTACENVATAR